MRTRPNSFSTKGVVASSSQAASIAGAKIKAQGGNVADAAIATSAVLCVTQNNLCGLGGDMFALIRFDGKEIIDLNASGRAFELATIEHFREQGLSKLNARGPVGALTVPGIVSGWAHIHNKYCTMEVKDLLNPAIEVAEKGFPVTQNYSESIRISEKVFSGMHEWNKTFLPDGKPPVPGDVFRQKDLASSLKSLAEDGLSSFYDGNLADRIVKGLEGSGSLLQSSDLKKHYVTYEKARNTEINGKKIYETCPNSQGYTALLWLNLLEASAKDPTAIQKESLSSVIAAGMLAYSQRDMYITDPKFHPLPDGFTSKEFARKLLERGNKRRNASGHAKDNGDTTYMCIADSEGNSFSWIQSNYMGFGSGVMPAGTGFVLQNRGSYFSLDPEHHNSLAPFKRTFHTLCAGMLEEEGQFKASFGAMGGDIQPQLHIQMILPLLSDLSDPQEILDRPRWAFPYTIYEKPSEIICESEQLKDSILSFYEKGKVRNIGFSSQFGHSQIVTLLSQGSVAGAADPRGDGTSMPFL
ncbi:MAG: gamma-glutamyltransferase family protein [Thermoplasmata archaeon]